MKISLFVLAMAGLLTASRAKAADSNFALNSWLSAQTNMQTWSADFVQTRRFKTLTKPLTEKGKVWFTAPNRFRWEMGNPVKMIAIRATDELLLIYPLLKQVERYPLNANAAGPFRDAMALIDAGFPRSQAELESKFRITLQVVTNDICDLILQPKSAAARKMMPQIEVAFDLNLTMLKATELQFADGSSLRNDFSNGVLNPKVDDQQFAPTIPPDYKVSEPMKK